MYGDKISYCRGSAQEQMLPSHAFGTVISYCLPLKGDRSNSTPLFPLRARENVLPRFRAITKKQPIHCMHCTFAYSSFTNRRLSARSGQHGHARTCSSCNMLRRMHAMQLPLNRAEQPCYVHKARQLGQHRRANLRKL
jgi:hypothetical protein